jgi:hypothetical protein
MHYPAAGFGPARAALWRRAVTTRRTKRLTSPRGSRFTRVIVAAIAAAASAAAFQALPPGGQVNDDAAAGINKNLSVNGDDPTNADVVGGALVAGKPAVPWSIFRQQEDGTSQPHDQIFSGSFAGGAWLTRGNGTVGGRSSASPAFSGSLNFDQGQDGEAPAIDFAGAGRATPWATWYENTTGPIRPEQHLRQPVRRRHEQVDLRGPEPRHRRRWHGPGIGSSRRRSPCTSEILVPLAALSRATAS